MKIDLEQAPNRVIHHNKKAYLYFGGTSYLGITTSKKFQKILIDSIQKWGTTHGCSRHSNITLNIYKKGEAYLSKYITSEALVTTSSGTVSASIAIDYLINRENRFFSLQKNLHPALRVKESQPVFIDTILNPILTNHQRENITILCESIPSLSVNPPDFGFLNHISKEKNITLLIDESHSLGICGENGNGFFETIATKTNCTLIMVASLNKALGIPGGLIASDTCTISDIKNTSAFKSASPMPPSFLDTCIRATKVYDKKRKRLQEKLQFLHDHLNPNSLIVFNKQYPVIYFSEENIADYLFKKGIIITSFNYPTSNKTLNRIVITANHRYKDLIVLSNALNSYRF